ncbi:peptide chain release factor N(5)-glutamine methyltransferase [Enterococcus cecorum]|uniref:peptide chain release factor N(5)-glutamine methyltransferase n=1 Tax=Enterococcus cecorum TaxID=44008 RepID=UPI002ACA0843|nr:peptide chain release factor N(5)-glutamine methyltransferase [Enterococcus cecorum]MDZ5502680.1 peptide chain release factor N(5)-glutamine methyltransferase [Enterococcus cecorum]MDZ5556581.1 peptide chain release factor N(5)-glutamine methyltransferase [Enterococcus cecorum]MDZ5558716.1 peptide chain release factor N(5)-glutamine methyltransferase [Enterococcus cecorum]MDZ5591556.1 peptide chain release factor N(5)-glutamine methyltransferase [Enterococcus cecorum]MDZ5612333.1 peptide ch
MGKNSYREVLARASSFLEQNQLEGHMIEYVFLQRKHWNKTDYLLHMHEPITAEDQKQIDEDMAKLLAHYPPQYLIGNEVFLDYRLKVTPDTLIPRPETEELVEKCLKLTQKQANQDLKVVDVGTGTGAIAISLKDKRPTWQVSAVDLSSAALEVAQENAQQIGVALEFILSDCLDEVVGPIDVLISNPPYISKDEYELMDVSVREFEPKMALFAENNGLAIYEKLAKQAQSKLAKDGKIFLEIGFMQGSAVKELFRAAFPKKQVSIHQDLFGNDRMIVVE